MKSHDIIRTRARQVMGLLSSEDQDLLQDYQKILLEDQWNQYHGPPWRNQLSLVVFLGLGLVGVFNFVGWLFQTDQTQVEIQLREQLEYTQTKHAVDLDRCYAQRRACEVERDAQGAAIKELAQELIRVDP